MSRYVYTLVLVVFLACICPRSAYHSTRLSKGILLWQVQLSPDQCGSPKWTPCYNVYAVNETHGDLVWFAFTTSSAAVKGMHLGRHSVYYTTWNGPGLYAVNPTNGHVRWQFPLDNWFRYWVKDIDLDRSASFGAAAEVRDVVYVAAAGPPARLYGVSTKGGSRQWEYKLPQSSATLAGIAGSSDDNSAQRGTNTVFMAVNQPSSNSSWVQALGLGSGKVVWQSAALNGTLLGGLELQESDRVLLATNMTGDGLVGLDAGNGSVLWSRSGSFCKTPSLAADVYKGQLLLSESCTDLSGLSAVDVVTGEELWSGWDAPAAAQPAGNCTAINEAASSIFFGCRCHARAHRHGAETDGAAAASGSGGSSSAGSGGSSGSSSSRKQPATAAGAWDSPTADDGAHAPNAACMYALSSSSGKLRWVLPLLGNATFPEGAQQGGMGPVLTGNLAIFLATDRVIGVNLLSGKLRWTLQLPRGEVLRSTELPVVDSDSEVVVIAAAVQGSNKTGLSGVSLREGRLLWHRTVNGTLQRGELQSSQGPLSLGLQRLTLAGGRVFVEACRGSRCCLRALNVTTGKQKWGMCLDAVQGDDATHPHAQFAIWFITLLTIVSIALLVLGAGLVYIQRWREERRILYGAGAPGSPRHTYQTLRGSDSEDG